MVRGAADEELVPRPRGLEAGAAGGAHGVGPARTTLRIEDDHDLVDGAHEEGVEDGVAPPGALEVALGAPGLQGGQGRLGGEAEPLGGTAGSQGAVVGGVAQQAVGRPGPGFGSGDLANVALAGIVGLHTGDLRCLGPVEAVAQRCMVGVSAREREGEVQDLDRRNRRSSWRTGCRSRGGRSALAGRVALSTPEHCQRQQRTRSHRSSGFPVT